MTPDDEKPEHYGLESGDAAAKPPIPAAHSSDVIIPGKPLESSPIHLEGEHGGVTPSASSSGSAKPSVKDLDVCPNCGASMGGGDVLVCLRCGFDLKTMKVVETKTGVAEVDVEALPEHVQPLVMPGLGDLWLPGAMAGIAGLVLVIGFLAGYHGLFPSVVVTTAGVGEHAVTVTAPSAGTGILDRFFGLLQEVARIGMWTLCGLAGLGLLSHLLAKPFGDLKLAAMRMLGIVTVMRLASLMDFTSPTVEWMLEAVVEAAVFTGLSIMLFRLKPRDAPTLTGATLVTFMALWLGARLIVWAGGVNS